MKMGSQIYVRSECVWVFLLEGAPAIACAPLQFCSASSATGTYPQATQSQGRSNNN